MAPSERTRTAFRLLASLLILSAAVQSVARTAPVAYAVHGSQVSVIDTTTDMVVAAISIPDIDECGPADGVVFAPDGTRAYVTVSGSCRASLGFIVVLDTATHSVLATIPGGDTPARPAITPDGAFLYVPNQGTDDVTVIDTATNTAVATIPIDVPSEFEISDPFAIAITPDGQRGYVTNSNASYVAVIDVTSNMQIAAVEVGSPLFGIAAPAGVAASPGGSRIYVANQGSANVSVIDTATNTVIASIPAGYGPYGIAVTPDGTAVYVTDVGETGFGSLVHVVDTATLAVVDTIEVGTSPGWVAINEDGSKAYVSNYWSSDVSVISTATKTVIGTIPLPSGPHSIAIQPELLPSLTVTEMIEALRASAATLGFYQADHLLESTLEALASGREGAACQKLAAFISQVSAQADKQLSMESAAKMTADAIAIRKVLGCRD